MTPIQKLNETCTKSSVSLIAGYTGMGISQLALCITKVDPNKKLLYISLRDFQESTSTLIDSISSPEDGLGARSKIISDLYPTPISIIDRVLIYQEQRYNHFILDDLNQIEGSEFEVEEMLSSLKRLCLLLNINITVLYTLGESITRRGGEKRPLPEDLNPRHYLKSIPDSILMLNRPEFWGIVEDENGNSTINRAEVFVSQSNLGATEPVELDFDPQSGRFG